MDNVKKPERDPEPRASISPRKSRYNKCAFCHREQDEPVLYGELKRANKIVAHYYCILLSTDLLQRGRDNEGIDGFLISDIRKAIINSRNVKCVYCTLPNATARCRHKGCNKVFHFPCGLDEHAVSQFCNLFGSFCDRHNFLRLENHTRYFQLGVNPPSCIYCQERIRTGQDYYVTKCCGACIMHMICLKRHALAFGYFTRCPNCNNQEEFVYSIRHYGVFVPSTDTLWDLDNEINQQFELHLQCEATVCRCRHNRRDHNAKSGHCKLCVCRICGGNAAHYICKRSKGYSYVCSVCRPVIDRNKTKTGRKQRQTDESQNMNPRVVIVRLTLAELRARGITTLTGYNLRSRSNTH